MATSAPLAATFAAVSNRFLLKALRSGTNPLPEEFFAASFQISQLPISVRTKDSVRGAARMRRASRRGLLLRRERPTTLINLTQFATTPGISENSWTETSREHGCSLEWEF